MITLMKTRAIYATKNAVVWTNALEGMQRCVCIVSILLGANVGTNQGKMVVDSLYETFKSLPSGQKKIYLNEMKEKLKEGSQIILSDTESVPGTILCKAILFKMTVIQAIL